MFVLLRIIFGLGFFGAMGFAASYLITGNYRHLIYALRLFLITIAAAVVVLIGIYLERLIWGV